MTPPVESERGLSILAVGLRYPPYVAGGYELLTRDAVEGLRGRGHRVRVLCGAGADFDPREVEQGRILPWLRPELDGDEDLFQRSFGASNLERFQLHFLRPANLRATQRALDVEATDLLLFFNLSHVSLGPVLAARHLEVPTLGYVADPWPENHWLRAWREQAARAGSSGARKSLGLAALGRAWQVFRGLVGLGPLLASSADLRAHLIADGLAGAEVDVLHLGLPPDMVEAAAAAEPAGRSAGEALRVVCTSFQWSGKGQHVLLEAVARAREAGVAVELDLAGGGDAAYVADLGDQARDPRLAGAVRFHGLLGRDALSALLVRSHAFVLPSLWGEPFGLATLEAMAHGLPAVVTDSGASPEIVRDRVDGRIVATGDAGDLAAVLAELAGNEECRRSLGAAARARVAETFTHGRFLDGLEGAARRAAARRGA